MSDAPWPHPPAPKLCLHRSPCSKLVLHDGKAWFRGEDSESDLEVLALSLQELPSYRSQDAAKRAALGWLALGPVGALASQAAEPDHDRAFAAQLNLEGMEIRRTLHLRTPDNDLDKVLAHFGLSVD